MIVVTGATGHLGTLVVRGLAARVPAGEVVAAVRDPKKAEGLAALGVQVREADYDRPETLGPALEGAEKVLLISGSEPGRRVPQHRAVVEAAKAAGVRHLAYTGILGGPETDFPLADDHKGTEEVILASGLAYTFLRNGWYTENYTGDLSQVFAQGAVTASAGDGRVASAARQDYADAAVAVLTGEGHENTAYELSGDEAWSFAEFAAELSRQTGREIRYNALSAEAHRELLAEAGLPAHVIEIIVTIDDGIRRGLLARRTGDLSRLIGRPTTPLADSIAAALKQG